MAARSALLSANVALYAKSDRTPLVYAHFVERHVSRRNFRPKMRTSEF